jgi:hypothetical protein
MNVNPIPTAAPPVPAKINAPIQTCIIPNIKTKALFHHGTFFYFLTTGTGNKLNPYV